MLVVPVGPDMQMAVAGSSKYSGAHGPRQTPSDLGNHSCINLRPQARNGNSIWDLEEEGHAVNVRVDRQLIVNDIAIVRQAAVDGVGMCDLSRDYLQDHIDGDLIPFISSKFRE